MWKDILGYEGKYQVSTTGQIKSLKTGKLMSFQLGGNGYYKVGLRINGNKERLIVHRLVALAFIENPHSKAQVNHIDGNKLNNNVCNLEWVTPSENSLHAFKTGLRSTHYKNTGKKFGKTSNYHYVERVNSAKDGVIYRTIVKATVNGKLVTRSKQFSVRKHGEHLAEVKAALAANEIIKSHSEFKEYPLNVID